MGRFRDIISVNTGLLRIAIARLPQIRFLAHHLGVIAGMPNDQAVTKEPDHAHRAVEHGSHCDLSRLPSARARSLSHDAQFQIDHSLRHRGEPRGSADRGARLLAVAHGAAA